MNEIDTFPTKTLIRKHMRSVVHYYSAHKRLIKRLRRWFRGLRFVKLRLDRSTIRTKFSTTPIGVGLIGTKIVDSPSPLRGVPRPVRSSNYFFPSPNPHQMKLKPSVSLAFFNIHSVFTRFELLWSMTCVCTCAHSESVNEEIQILIVEIIFRIFIRF